MKLTRRRGNDGGASAGEDTKSTKAARAQDETPPEPPAKEPPKAREFGPYDVTEAPRGQEVLDLGALRIPAVAGVEVHLQAGPEGQIQQVQLAHGSSRLQVAAFAAPRTEGIWDDIRETLREALVSAGSKPRDGSGEYGPELTARIKEGDNAIDVRHIGIDGPRWFVHAVYIGAAAVDPDQAGPLRDVLRGLVVDRGVEARPVSEGLPLRLPPEAAAQLAAANGPGSSEQVT